MQRATNRTRIWRSGSLRYPLTVPTITLDGDTDGVVPATDGKSTAAKFVGERQHRVIPNFGHNLPQENPAAFAAAVWELASKTLTAPEL
jgi:pimeloyl-ACP methyl ester carboxylesterase